MQSAILLWVVNSGVRLDWGDGDNMALTIFCQDAHAFKDLKKVWECGLVEKYSGEASQDMICQY